MKNINNSNKSSFLKKVFIKICRKLGYEIIDQNKFEVLTSNKKLNEELSILGYNSINLPLGEIKITRKVRALDIIIRTCASVNMLTQNKKRLFEEEKIVYTLRTIKSLLNSVLDPGLTNLEINFKVIDHNSTNENLKQIDDVFKKFGKKYSLINLDVSKFKNQIEKTNQRGKDVTSNQISNMANIHQSLLESKNCEDLIYFVEDDYLHRKNSLKEMIFTYERITSQLNKEIIICPADYPYLYAKSEMTQNFLGHKYHWRRVNETLCTFLTSKNIIEKYWEKYTEMCKKEHAPFEKPLHDIYKKELCISPIPSLALHFTNINSIFGLSPNVDWKKIWDENEN
ncbi:glycosyltransferase family 2 protein [Candidatus Pelagibacter bacterium]|nr:glycosyltransferase family 2 protein [Candidatus Pelagibacter bacterium]